MIKLNPIRNRIVVVVDDADATTEQGIIIPNQSQEKPESGLVIAVGPGNYHPKTGELIPVGVTVGDRIIFHKQAGQDVEIEGESFKIMFDDDVMAVVN